MTESNRDAVTQLERAYRLLAQASSTVSGLVRDLAKVRDELTLALGDRDEAKLLVSGLARHFTGSTVYASGIKAVGRLASPKSPGTLRPDDTPLDGLKLTICGWVDLTRVIGTSEPGWIVERHDEPGFLAVRMSDIAVPA